MTGTGTLLVRSISPSLTTPTIAGATLSGTMAGTPTFSGLTTFSAGLSVATTQKINLNVGATCYLYEPSSNNFALATSSAIVLQGNANGLGMVATKKFFLEDVTLSAGAWIQAPSTNNITLGTVAAGSLVNVNALGIGMFAGGKMFWDGTDLSGDTYTYQSSPNVLDTYVGGTLSTRINSAGEALMPAVDPPTANYANQNSIVKGYAYIGGNTAGPSFALLLAGYNVSSVPNNNSADKTINWNTDFANTNYVVTLGVSGAFHAYVKTKNVGSTVITVTQLDGTAYAGLWQVDVTAVGTQ